MQGSEDLREALQVVVERRSTFLRARRRGKAAQDDESTSEISGHQAGYACSGWLMQGAVQRPRTRRADWRMSCNPGVVLRSPSASGASHLKSSSSSLSTTSPDCHVA